MIQYILYKIAFWEVALLTELYIVRHGETDFNIRHACLGHSDIPLNETGQEQVRLLAKRLIDVEFDAVYVSPLARAVDTAAAIKKKAPMTMSYGLIERDYGDWENMTLKEIEAKYPDKYREWRANWIDFVLPNGESAAQHQKRVDETLDKITNEHKNERILIVTHLGTARHIISHILGLSAEQSWRFTLDNAGVAIMQSDSDGKWLLKGLNI